MYGLDDAYAGEAEARARIAAPQIAVPGLSAVDQVAAPASPEVPAAPTKVEGTLGTNATVKDDQAHTFGLGPEAYTQTMLSAFQDPETLTKMGEIALKYQQPQWLDFLKRGYEAQKENAGTAVMKLLAGDTQGSMDAFNSTGGHKVTSLTPVGDGTYDAAAVGPDGIPYTRRIDPKKEALGLLTAPQFIVHQDREKEIDAKALALDSREKNVNAQVAGADARAADRESTRREIARITELHQSGMMTAAQAKLELQGKLNEAQIKLLLANAGKADAAAGALDAKADAAANGDYRPDAKTLQQVKEAASKGDYVMTDDGTGVKKMDGSKYTILASTAQALVKADPQKYRGNGAQAVLDAQVRLQEIEAMAKKHVDTIAAPVITDAPGSMSFASTRKDYWKNAAIPGLDGSTIKVPSSGAADFKKKANDIIARQALDQAGLRGDTSGSAAGTTAPAASGLHEGPDGRLYTMQNGAPTPVPDGATLNGGKFTIKGGKLVPTGVR